MPTDIPYSGATPSIIEGWRKEWEDFFLNTTSIDVHCDRSWDMLTIKLPVLLHLAKLGAMINTDDPTAELFRLAMIGLAHENEQKAER